MINKHIVRGIIGFAAGYVMYKSIIMSFTGMALFVLFSFLNRQESVKLKKQLMTERFLVFLTYLEPLLMTSGTFSRFFTEAVSDYRQIHGKDELYAILYSAVNGFRLNLSTSTVLADMAVRLNVEDAYLFAGSVSICESAGGNLIAVTRKTADLLGGKIKIIREINIILSGKRMEQKIITIMPLFLIGLLSIVSESYLAPIYETTAGRVVMSAAGLLFLAEWVLCKKITGIKV